MIATLTAHLALASKTVVAYVVRKTYFDDTPHEDVGRFDVSEDFLQCEAENRPRYTNSYSEALDLAYQVRTDADHRGYAVIDTICADGSRGQG
jgi:hypothetical protein